MKNFLPYLTSLCCLVEILTWESKQQESSKSELNWIIVAFVENFFLCTWTERHYGTITSAARIRGIPEISVTNSQRMKFKRHIMILVESDYWHNAEKKKKNFKRVARPASFEKEVVLVCSS